MFKHQGKSRTSRHNLQIAIFLSFVAGIVNVTGYLAFDQLTTNVTGHFALFINDVANFEFWRGTIYFVYIFSFLLGSFMAGLLIEAFHDNQKLNVYVLPTLLECLILISIVVYNYQFTITNSDVIVCALLLAMGLQNSYVTKISDAVVRTTHLTGLFTDLGIELSQLLFSKARTDRMKLKSNIMLRVYIISFFFSGGLVGGFFYSRLQWQLNTLLIGVAILLLSLVYDDLSYGWQGKKLPH